MMTAFCNAFMLRKADCDTTQGKMQKHHITYLNLTIYEHLRLISDATSTTPALTEKAI